MIKQIRCFFINHHEAIGMFLHDARRKGRNDFSFHCFFDHLRFFYTVCSNTFFDSCRCLNPSVIPFCKLTAVLKYFCPTDKVVSSRSITCEQLSNDTSSLKPICPFIPIPTVVNKEDGFRVFFFLMTCTIVSIKPSKPAVVFFSCSTAPQSLSNLIKEEIFSPDILLADVFDFFFIQAK